MPWHHVSLTLRRHMPLHRNTLNPWPTAFLSLLLHFESTPAAACPSHPVASSPARLNCNGLHPIFEAVVACFQLLLIQVTQFLSVHTLGESCIVRGRCISGGVLSFSCSLLVVLSLASFWRDQLCTCLAVLSLASFLRGQACFGVSASSRCPCLGG